MKHYRVLLNGANFLINIDGQQKKLGFYTTRFVAAPDEKSAENAAVQSLRDRQSLRDVVLNDRADPPLIHAEEIVEISMPPESKQDPEPGLAWYAEDGTDLTESKVG